MFNNHEDIVKIVRQSIEDAYNRGYNDSGYEHISQHACSQVQQRLEYMQSQIDTLQAIVDARTLSDVMRHKRQQS